MPPLALRVCAACAARWNAAHVAINADPAARARRRRAQGDVRFAEYEQRRWRAEDVRQPKK